jgi:hypothetical protein
MDNLIKSNITIGGKEFPVKLSKKEQKHVQTIEKEIADKIKAFQQHYANMSMQDCLSMICIEQAFNIHNNKGNSEVAVSKVLDTLEQELAK